MTTRPTFKQLSQQHPRYKIQSLSYNSAVISEEAICRFQHLAKKVQHCFDVTKNRLTFFSKTIFFLKITKIKTSKTSQML